MREAALIVGVAGGLLLLVVVARVLRGTLGPTRTREADTRSDSDKAMDAKGWGMLAAAIGAFIGSVAMRSC